MDLVCECGRSARVRNTISAKLGGVEGLGESGVLGSMVVLLLLEEVQEHGG
jgi:hypothetical protein